MNAEQIYDIVHNLCSQAIKEAQPLILDYSPASIHVLDKLFKRHRHDISSYDEGYKDEELWQLTSIYGAYLGVMLLSNGLSQYGYQWSVDSKNLLILRSHSRSFSPLSKVYHCLCDGSSIEPFYHGTLSFVKDDRLYSTHNVL